MKTDSSLVEFLELVDDLEFLDLLELLDLLFLDLLVLLLLDLLACPGLDDLLDFLVVHFVGNILDKRKRLMKKNTN